MSCQCILKTGTRAGQPCEARLKKGPFCGRHANCTAVVSAPKVASVQKSAEPSQISRTLSDLSKVVLPSPLVSPTEQVQRTIRAQIVAGSLDKAFLTHSSTREFTRYLLGYIDYKTQGLEAEKRKFIKTFLYENSRANDMSLNHVLKACATRFGTDIVRARKNALVYYIFTVYGKMYQVLNKKVCTRCQG